jgi:hypothetical protein
VAGRRDGIEAVRALVLGAAAGREMRQDGGGRHVGQLVGEVQVPSKSVASMGMGMPANYREPVSAR